MMRRPSCCPRLLLAEVRKVSRRRLAVPCGASRHRQAILILGQLFREACRGRRLVHGNGACHM